MQANYGFGGIAPQQYGMMRDAEKKTLRRQSIRAGLCVLAFVLLQYGLLRLFSGMPAVCALYNRSDAFANLWEILFYLCSMFVPFLVAYLLMDATEKQEVDCFCKPTCKAAAILAVISGFFFCTLGDFVTNYLVALLESFGFSLEGGTYETPANGMQLVFDILAIGIIPALVEEFSLHGVVMQPMRRLGDKFAIGMSAFVFALMHGNLVQIPFAFIAGIAIGYYVIATDSLWVGIAIHFLNNLYSVILNYLLEARPTAAETLYNVVNSVTLVAGIVATVCFVKVLQKRVPLQKKVCARSTGEKVGAYIFTVPMILAILVLIVETSHYVSYTGYVG